VLKLERKNKALELLTVQSFAAKVQDILAVKSSTAKVQDDKCVLQILSPCVH